MTRNVAFLLMSAFALTSCQQAVGPSRSTVMNFPTKGNLSALPEGVDVVELTPTALAAEAGLELATPFSVQPGDAVPIGTNVGVGDALEVSIWEAPPAVLFGAATITTRIGADVGTSRPTTLPELIVGPDGTVPVPFAGNVPASGRSLVNIGREITRRLNGKANKPQVIVRLARNATANVTVLGEVGRPTRIPLTPKGERLLDVVASAGGASKPIDKLLVELTRGASVYRMPLQSLIADPRSNIVLAPDDVVALQHQPNSFTALGASGRNEEIPFEATGITLDQALGRIAGLQDGRGDARGVFLFRWVGNGTAGEPKGKPTIYRIDLRDPATYFALRKFAMRDGDIVYVATSPTAEFQRFVNTIASTVLPVVSVSNSVGIK